MKRLCLILAFLISLAVAAVEPVRVACVGNSITFGFRLPDPGRDSYPSQLQRMLGSGYEVGNFGNSGSTLLEKGHKPYVKVPEYQAALDFNPDIVVIHLGVNDTDPRNWPNYSDEFVSDYVRLIDSFKTRNPQVRVIIALLTPLRATHYRFRTGTRDWRLLIQRDIAEVARLTGAELIDFDSPLRDRQNLLHDGIHPDAEGAGLLAETVRGAITGSYGGLSLPPVWQSGMIVQRNRPLTVCGRADASAPIALTLDGRTYRTRADNRGDWQLTTAPLVTGPTYTLSVTDGADTLILTDILAGEVWIASGQSNMEFPLGFSPEPDSLLRVYDQKPLARTDNVFWPDSVRAEMDALRHFRPARWQAPDASFSAVAWHFARELRDSLQVPVGIIANAVGGSPAESWIDVNTLEAEVPEILVDWRSNDYLQKWVQRRVAENIGRDAPASARHPYEPSYLFSAAIRPLSGFPVAGTIWYQGESNAHNVELHERLFPLLVSSWRREFRQPEMPFYFVQLSSLNRPSWPSFRDSQRRLALSVPFTAMAVSSDVGDSLDVHPRLKQPVGNRLSRIALHRTYGFAHVADQGPSLSRAISLGNQMILELADADGLTTSDGLPPRVFELSESANGLYYPALAEISDNKIILTSMNVTSPRFVRYAWQPFTRSNVVNADGLPMSTFKAEASNAADLDIEPGYEFGVSAPFFGRLDNRMIIAGGANFPCADPLAPGAQKVIYRGIYAAPVAGPDSLHWRRIGSLPDAMAYGASAQTPDGPVFIAPDRRVWRLNADGSLTDLPSMPVAVDNAAAACIGRTVYVCGGNLDGKPSRSLFALNLDEGKWKELKKMPGNPRVQPAMAATRGKLYLWGGFAGKHDGKDATLETSGLCYDPASNKWTPLPAPHSTEATSLGGGSALTLSDGRIAALGGVNKDIFLAALQNQAPDYLEHPIDWYRFNQHVLIFDPVTEQWTVALTAPDAARAGAAAIPGSDSDLYLYGGELKPRIRTSATLYLPAL